MIDELNAALESYNQKWQLVVVGRKDTNFFKKLKPTALGWKTQDKEEYHVLLAELHDRSDMVIEKWMNGRWIAKVHLKDAKLINGVEIVKIMQRRPGSNDAVGLDHVDFYAPTSLAQNKDVLTRCGLTARKPK
jgi:hypothetical protein